MFPRILLASLLTLGLLAACTSADITPGVPSPTPAATSTVTPPAQTSTAHSGPVVLRVWLPPRFDPASDALLQARLDAFLAAHPGLLLDVRVKEEDGAAGLLESLLLTSAAAPAALPDLVALPRGDLERAAQAGVIQPLDGLAPTDDGLTFSARALAHVQNVPYGVPFALDALVLGSTERGPLLGWADIVREGPLAFNGQDGQFPLALYLAAGGALTNEQGQTFLDEAILTRVLTLFAQDTVASMDSDEQVWGALAQEGGGFAVGWATSLKRSGPPGVRVEALPGFDDSPGTLVTGWAWSVASLDVERQTMAVELAQWLTADEFLGPWNTSTGWLLPHTGTEWDAVLSSARLVPSSDAMTVIDALLVQSVAEVIGGVTPEAAAHAAVESLK